MGSNSVTTKFSVTKKISKVQKTFNSQAVIKLLHYKNYLQSLLNLFIVQVTFLFSKNTSTENWRVT